MVRQVISLRWGLIADSLFTAYNHNQPGDAKKGVSVMIDVIKGEGVAKDKEFTPVVLMGSDCYNTVRGILTKAVTKFDEWKDITISTDRDDL